MAAVVATTPTTVRPRPPREQTAGTYRVRLAFHAPGHGGDHAHHQHGAAKPAATGHLVVLVNDADDRRAGTLSAHQWPRSMRTRRRRAP